MDYTTDDDLELASLKPTAADDQELEDELDALHEEVAAEDAAPAGDGFDELEALLGDALEAQSEAAKLKELRKKQKGGYGLSEGDLERIRKWELAKEWIAVSNTAIFKRYVCACGFHSTVFEGLMLEQKHRHDKHANRWTAQATSVANLPNNTAIRTKPIPMCQRCALGKGFSLVTDLQWRDE